MSTEPTIQQGFPGALRRSAAELYDDRTLRLDVIDTNPAARRLYERVGFRPVRTERYPYLKWLLGFEAATQMQVEVKTGA